MLCSKEGVTDKGVFWLKTGQLLALSLVTIWWAGDAIQKYNSQPLATHIYYTFGDQRDANIRREQPKTFRRDIIGAIREIVTNPP